MPQIEVSMLVNRDKCFTGVYNVVIITQSQIFFMDKAELSCNLYWNAPKSRTGQLLFGNY